MIANLFSFLTSTFVGLAMTFGGALPGRDRPSAPHSLQDGAGISATDQPQRDSQGPLHRRGWPYRGDPAVRAGLLLATVSAADLRPVEVLQGLHDGQSLDGIATSAGSSAAEVLALFDETAQHVLQRAVEEGRLPESMVPGRLAWYQEAARQMVTQPGMAPAYPGLHELHITLIRASVRVTGLERGEIRQRLQGCETLAQVLAAEGHDGHEAVDLAMKPISFWLDRLTEGGKLDEAQQQSWGTGLRTALESMLTAPGLHFAGKTCLN